MAFKGLRKIDWPELGGRGMTSDTTRWHQSNLGSLHEM
jgi:hypothetical protein